MFNKPINVPELLEHLDKYKFVCDSVVIMPDIQIYEKETNKLIANTSMRIESTSGSLNPEYSEKFFKDINDEIPQAFVSEMKKRITKFKGEVKDGET